MATLPRVLSRQSIETRLAALEGAGGGGGGGSGESYFIRPGFQRAGQLRFGGFDGGGYSEALGGVTPTLTKIPAGGTVLVPFVIGNDGAGYQYQTESVEAVNGAPNPLLRPGRSATQSRNVNTPISDASTYVPAVADRVGTKAVLSPLKEANRDGNVRAWGEYTHAHVAIAVKRFQRNGSYVPAPLGFGDLRANVYLSNSSGNAVPRRTMIVDRHALTGSGSEEIGLIVPLDRVADGSGSNDSTMFFEVELVNSTGADLYVVGWEGSYLAVSLMRYSTRTF